MGTKTANRRINIFLNGKAVTGTIKAFRQEFRKLNNQIANTKVGTEEYERQAKRLQYLKSILNQHRNNVNGISKAWKNNNRIFEQFVGFAAAKLTAEQVFQMGKEFFDAGKKLDQLEQKARTVFGEAFPRADRAAQKHAKQMGLTRSEYLALASEMQDILIPMRFQREEAAQMSTDINNLSGALSEWTLGKITTTEVSGILASALTGEREQLKRLGIVIQEADIKTRLAEKGLTGLTGEYLQQAKAISTLELITEKSGDAQNAFTNNTESTIRKQAELRATLEKVKSTIAQGLAPVFSRLIVIASEYTDTIAGYFEIPVADKLQEEQSELNILVAEITQANLSQKERNALINNLQQRYPEFLSNLNAEKVTNEELGKRLREVNNQYIFKIALSKDDGKIQKQAAKVAKARRKLAEREREITKKIIDLNKTYNIDVDLTNKTLDERIKITNELLIQKSHEMTSEIAALRLNQERSKIADNSRNKLQEKVKIQEQELTNLQKIREELKQQLALQLGIQDADKLLNPEDERIELGAGLKDQVVDKKGEKAAAKEQKALQRKYDRLIELTKRYEEQLRLSRLEEDERTIEEIRLKYAKELEVVQELEEAKFQGAAALRKELETLRDQEITETEQQLLRERFDKLLQSTLEFQQEFEESKLSENERTLQAIRDKYDQEIALALELEAQGVFDATAQRLELEDLKKAELEAQEDLFQEERLERMRAFQEQLDTELGTELDNELAQLDQHYTALIAKAEKYNIDITDIIAKYYAEQDKIRAKFKKKEVDDEQRVYQAKKDIQLAQVQLFRAVSQQLGNIFGESAAAQNAFFLFEKGLAAAEVIINLQKQISAIGAKYAGIPGVGPALITAEVTRAKIQAATSLVTIAGTAISKFTQKKEGGWMDAVGQDDNLQYRAQYVGHPGTGMLPDHPVIVDTSAGTPVLASERGREYFVANHDLRKPAVLNHVRAIENITRAPRNFRQFVDGGATAELPSPSPAPAGNTGISEATMNRFAEALENIQALLERGVVARFENIYDTVEQIRDAADDIDEARGV